MKCKAIGANEKGKITMNELGKEFLKSWDEFKNAVLGKIPPPPECKDPVLIVMNSGLFKLTNDEFVNLMILSIVHTSIESGYGAEVAISAALTTERVDILRQITASIKASR